MLQETRTVIIEKTRYNQAFYYMLEIIDAKIDSYITVENSFDAVENYERGNVRVFVDGRWLLDKKVRNVLLDNGFIIRDSIDHRYNGMIQKLIITQ